MTILTGFLGAACLFISFFEPGITRGVLSFDLILESFLITFFEGRFKLGASATASFFYEPFTLERKLRPDDGRGTGEALGGTFGDLP